MTERESALVEARRYLEGGCWSPVLTRHLVKRLADELEAQNKALSVASGGMELSFDALSRGLNDEALLHLGHHAAHAKRALGT